MATKKQNNTLNNVAKRFGITAREARDIATAVGNIGSIVRNTPGTTAKGGKAKQLGAAAKEIKKQVKETGRAAVTGKSGTRSKQYMTNYGDDSARLMRVKRK
jgi:predicted transcriptional regulator